MPPREVSLEAAIEEVGERIARERHAVALTGAGISVASGIPDFRSDAGLWSRYPPHEYATIQAFRAHPERVWTMLFELHDTVSSAAPNPGHVALAELEAEGVLDAVVTQNVDGLHQRAGNSRVVELHGGAQTLHCPRCQRDYAAADVEIKSPTAPRCECGVVLKPDLVLFGENLSRSVLAEAHTLATRASILLVVGTSAVVVPASELPAIAFHHGAMLVEVNLSTTPVTTLTSYSLRGDSVDILPKLAAAVRSHLAA